MANSVYSCSCLQAKGSKKLCTKKTDHIPDYNISNCNKSRSVTAIAECTMGSATTTYKQAACEDFNKHIPALVNYLVKIIRKKMQTSHSCRQVGLHQDHG